MISFCILTNAGLAQQSHRERYLYRLLSSIQVLGLKRADYKIMIGGAIPEGVEADVLVPMAQEANKGQICKIRNALANRVTTELLVHCDDDILFTEGYADSILSVKDDPWDILCTRILNPNGTRYWDWAAFYEGKGQTLVPYDSMDKQMYATGGHAIYRKHVFQKVRWNESLTHGANEEFSFAADARNCGLRFSLKKSATVFLQYHHCDAQASIDRQPQKSEGTCSEFKAALSAADMQILDSVRNRHALLWNRIGHKIEMQEFRNKHPREVSILVGVYRYLQRFRIFAQGLLSQKYDNRNVEIIVANPGSPDGLSEYLQTLNKALESSGPHFTEVRVDERHKSNRGALIQEAFENSNGRYVIGMDCDIVVPTDFVDTIVKAMRENSKSVVGVYRNFLKEETTAKILVGMVDPVRDFNVLLKSEDEIEAQGFRGVLGYCQAASREAWESVNGYPTEFNDIARSDIAFVELLTKKGFRTLFLDKLRVLHLHHPRDWTGTSHFL